MRTRTDVDNNIPVVTGYGAPRDPSGFGRGRGGGARGAAQDGHRGRSRSRRGGGRGRGFRPGNGRGFDQNGSQRRTYNRYYEEDYPAEPNNYQGGRGHDGDGAGGWYPGRYGRRYYGQNGGHSSYNAGYDNR